MINENIISSLKVFSLQYCRALWADDVKDSQLIKLKLPSGFHPTGALLKQIAARHRSITSLSLSTPCERIVADECENPFKVFAHLNSLSVQLGFAFTCHSRTDHKSIGAIFNNTRIKSFALSGLRVRHFRRQGKNDRDVWYQSKQVIPSPVTTPNLIYTLVHLRLDGALDVQDAEYLLFHCRHLETLWLDRIYGSFVGTEYPPLITSHQHMSPYLRSATLGFDSNNEGWVS